jgi:hypothetical protein
MPAYKTREELEKAMQDAQKWLEVQPDRRTLETAVDLFIKLTDKYKKPGECRMHAFLKTANKMQEERKQNVALLALKRVEEEEERLRKK